MCMRLHMSAESEDTNVRKIVIFQFLFQSQLKIKLYTFIYRLDLPFIERANKNNFCKAPFLDQKLKEEEA